MAVGDLLEGGDLGGEGGEGEFGGVHGLGCFAVGAQFVDVLFDRRKVGGVGAVEAAAGALEADGAGAACGFDVAGFGAASVGDGDGAQFVGGLGAGAGSAVVVNDVGGELGDGVAFSFQGDGVVALGGADGLVIHQFAQDV
ncbi:hypothetical protein [Streptomyces sp. GbtcB7]|uniref:hypothetical protein n=1 Tax=Streptomyces sp. GbtcB7 TaxID=2824752 RepID=UPI0020C732BD|nr:hypothetical protein [Streptomyces sp. GbtcB7]